MDRSCKGPSIANSLSAPSSDEEIHFDDEIFREIEDYAREAEREEHVQAGDPPYICLRKMFGGRRERFRPKSLGLQLVEPHQ